MRRFARQNCWKSHVAVHVGNVAQVTRDGGRMILVIHKKVKFLLDSGKINAFSFLTPNCGGFRATIIYRKTTMPQACGKIPQINARNCSRDLTSGWFRQINQLLKHPFVT